MKKVLVVSRCSTHPITMGNRKLIYEYCKLLESIGCEVHFCYVHTLHLKKRRQKEEIECLNRSREYWGDKFHCFNVKGYSRIRYSVINKIRKDFFHGYWNVDDEHPHGLDAYVEELQKQYSFDALIVNYIYLSKLLENCTVPRKALFTHDTYAFKDIRVGIKNMDKSLMPNEEAKGIQRAPVVFAMQDQEADYFSIISPRSKILINYSNFDFFCSDIVGNHTLLFLSGSNIFNVNGWHWFYKEILPYIIKRFPDAQVIVGGGICDVLKADDYCENVKLYGRVKTPKDFFALGDISINPCYQGTGLKIKTFESIAFDKVTMAHPHSMIGVYDKANAPIFASQRPEDWVDFLEKAWRNPAFISEWKERNKDYMQRLNEFVVNEYKRFLEE